MDNKPTLQLYHRLYSPSTGKLRAQPALQLSPRARAYFTYANLFFFSHNYTLQWIFPWTSEIPGIAFRWEFIQFENIFFSAGLFKSKFSAIKCKALLKVQRKDFAKFLEKKSIQMIQSGAELILSFPLYIKGYIITDVIVTKPQVNNPGLIGSLNLICHQIHFQLSNRFVRQRPQKCVWWRDFSLVLEYAKPPVPGTRWSLK